MTVEPKRNADTSKPGRCVVCGTALQPTPDAAAYFPCAYPLCAGSPSVKALEVTWPASRKPGYDESAVFVRKSELGPNGDVIAWRWAEV